MRISVAFRGFPAFRRLTGRADGRMLSPMTPLPPRRILVACDKFKGSLSAQHACTAIARGLSLRWPDAEIHCLPIADGGEGFTNALAANTAARETTCAAQDALGRPIRARYLLADSADGPVAMMEMAEACGLRRIPEADRDILRAHSFGVGMMLRHAAAASGAARILLGIGGSATNDGGTGMAAALGVRFLSADGETLPPHPQALRGKLAHLDESRRVRLPPLTAACDVTNPLLGPNGATRVYGPQKGAAEAQLALLEQALHDLVRASGGQGLASTPGAGAAGGLGFGLLRFAGATLVCGFDLIAEITGLEKHIQNAELIITGEGSLDAQTLHGKGPAGVARLARKHNKPIHAYCGQADAAAHHSGLFDHIIELRGTGLPQPTLMRDAAGLLQHLSAQAHPDCVSAAASIPRPARFENPSIFC